MPYLLTKSAFVDTLRALVEEKPNFTYHAHDEMGCVYGAPTEENQPSNEWAGSCALGQLVERLDRDAFQQIVARYNTGIGWSGVVEAGLFEFENATDQYWIARVGEVFQENQDNDVPWDRAWEEAREVGERL